MSMRSLIWPILLALLGAAPNGWARVLITEVIPGVSQTQTAGDQVELFNTGPAAVDLTDWVITDLDPMTSEINPLSEGTFAPVALSVPALQPGEFCVVTFVDPAAPTGDNNSVSVTGYGLAITIELNPNFQSTNDQCALLDSAGNLVDSVAWHSLSASPTTDDLEDHAALTLPDPFTYPIGTIDSETGWAGPDGGISTAEYRQFAVDFSSVDGESATGNGSIQRINVGSQWMEGRPDAADFFLATAIGSATLGAHTFASMDGTLAVSQTTADLEQYIIDLTSAANGGQRIATAQNTDDFQVPSGLDRVIFRRVVDLMLAGDWGAANYFASSIGYEVIEWTDSPGTGDVFHVLQEIDALGGGGYRGLGFYVFDNTSINGMCIQVPHPIFDSLTHIEGAMMLVQIRPRVLMIAGTHRQNSTVDTTCSGTFSGGPHRASDVAHSTVAFFQMAHEQFFYDDPTAYVLQMHGFGATPSAFDVILSEGVNYTPPESHFIQVLENRIDAQMFLADGSDLTEAAVFSEDETVLGATWNTQGRVTNGIQWAMACETPVTSGMGDGHFIHIEQDIDVRQQPQHIIDAILETIGLLGVPAGITLFGQVP